MASTNKLARPPVKLACLSCRASRIRCDGNQQCSNCLAKDKACIYTKSKRGGPRQYGKRAAAAAAAAAAGQQQQQHQDTSVLEAERSILTPPREQVPPAPSSAMEDTFPDFQTDFFADLVSPMIFPGAGLKHLDGDQIFNNLFGGNPTEESFDIPVFEEDVESPPELEEAVCRAYGSDGAVLNAYYIFIHSYFPILPPPDSPPSPDQPLAADSEDFEPSSPLTLALLAILSLIPHPQDPDSRNQKSTLLRRQKAQMFAELAMESIEIDNELLTSSTSPSEALSNEPPTFRRDQFHPRCPVELESLLAYLLLAIYEYSQRGNIVKMRNRASQAYDAAIRMSLQEESEHRVRDAFAEARRRAWWMTYTCVLQGSIVSSLAPIIQVDHRSFRVPLPSVRADSEIWSCFLDAQQTILECTQFTVSLKRAIETQADLTSVQARGELLDNKLDLILSSYKWDLDGFAFTEMDSHEQVLATSLRAQSQIKLNSARIKLHRYRAFLDTPIFSRRHCDLRKIDSDDSQAPQASCCASSFRAIPPSPSPSSSSVSNSTGPSTQRRMSSSSTNPTASVGSSDRIPPATSPFSDPESARVCLKAALQISYAFDALPYPNPTPQSIPFFSPPFLSPTSKVPAPRTMPAFACCAMQASYALLMICRRSQDWNRSRNRNPFSLSSTAVDVRMGLDELHAGLGRVLSALTNYSIAFEALDGMRAQVQEAFDMLK